MQKTCVHYFVAHRAKKQNKANPTHIIILEAPTSIEDKPSAEIGYTFSQSLSDSPQTFEVFHYEHPRCVCLEHC